MAFRWRAEDIPLLVLFGSSLPSSKNKQKTKRCQNWTPYGKTFWIRAWTFPVHPYCLHGVKYFRKLRETKGRFHVEVILYDTYR